MGLAKYLARQVVHCHSMQQHRMITRQAGILEKSLDKYHFFPTAGFMFGNKLFKFIKLNQKKETELCELKIIYAWLIRQSIVEHCTAKTKY
jgi:hypothetical protein